MMIKGNQSRWAGPWLHLVDLDYELETDAVKKKKEEKFGLKKD